MTKLLVLLLCSLNAIASISVKKINGDVLVNNEPWTEGMSINEKIPLELREKNLLYS